MRSDAIKFVNRATLTDGMRTNNLCEAWNNGFMHRVGKAHPTIWALIEALKADNMNDETAIARHNQGLQITTRKNKKAQEKQDKLKKLCTMYQDETIDIADLLVRAARAVKFHSEDATDDNNN